MACDCIKEMTTLLKEHNTGLVTNLPSSRTFLETYTIVPKRGFKRPRVAATFCPFCGVRYEPAEENEARGET